MQWLVATLAMVIQGSSPEVGSLTRVPANPTAHTKKFYSVWHTTLVACLLSTPHCIEDCSGWVAIQLNLPVFFNH
ncbi:MAG: hypothetical protein RBR43_10400 [Desulfuromonadaceae bacterium]|nr:hypothetical protein [Desulfuromonadaceae bacterium]